MKDLLEYANTDNMENECVCLEDLPLAYAYIPYQQINKTYSKEDSLKNGTAFPELNKPYEVYGNEFNKKRVGVL